MKMTIAEFLDDFTRKHTIQNIKEINGVIIAPINNKNYLIYTDEVIKE